MFVHTKHVGTVMAVKSNGHHSPSQESLDNVHHNMLDGLGQLAHYFGFSKVMGQIYGALLLSPRPLCLDDLVEKLDISKANASMNMRTLENLGMVRQVWVRGTSGRRKFYEAETDFWQIITNVLKGREMRDVNRALTVMEDNIRQLNSAMDSLDEDHQELARLYLDRIARMQALFQFAQMMITTILTRVTDEEPQDLLRHHLSDDSPHA
ncbi:ArsR family transcriptional regulator [Anaerolineae bacterium CFX9]|nr:ArsR family transcriptional regulator [Anaerolineae bacterium CFX9]